MSDCTDSLVFQAADCLFDQLADKLLAKLKAMPPINAPSKGLRTLYQEFRRDCTFEATDQCREAWVYRLNLVAGQVVDELPMSLRRLLYVGTENGGEECLHLTKPEQIVMSGPWVQQELVNRLGWP